MLVPRSSHCSTGSLLPEAHSRWPLVLGRCGGLPSVAQAAVCQLRSLLEARVPIQAQEQDDSFIKAAETQQRAAHFRMRGSAPCMLHLLSAQKRWS